MTEKTTAQSLLDKLTANAKNSVVIEIAGTEFTFSKDAAAYDAMINEIDAGNKVTPIKDYLLTIVDRAQREELLSIINVPGLALKVAGTVNKALVPEIEITVKN